MRAHSLLLVLCGLVTGFLATPSASAQILACSNVCTPTSDCSETCKVPGAPPEQRWITCGEYGECAYQPPPCSPNWVVTSSQPIGGFAVYDYYGIGTCDYYGVYLLTWHDANNCGDPDYQACANLEHYHRDDHLCCSFWYCGGNTCGQP